MTRFSSSQIIIFLAVFLGISLLTNVMLAVDQNNLDNDLSELEGELTEKTALLASQTQKDQQRRVQLENVNSVQTEFAAVIADLQSEISNLLLRQQKSTETAELSKKQLEQARSTLLKNTEELESVKRELENARSVIQNQQRALWKAREQSGSLSESAELIRQKLTLMFSQDEQVRILQSSNTVQMNLPVAALFTSTEPELSAEASQWLQPFANILLSHPDVSIQVIGHADARPIVSDLSQRYPTNWELSTARASRVVSELVQLGVPASQLTAAGKASNEPVREVETEAAWMINRRIEFIIR